MKLDKEKLVCLMTTWIYKNFGEHEATEPCYNLEELADYILKNKNKDLEINIRTCKECGKIMFEGYCVENGMEYYCSDECLHKNISEEEWNKLYDEGNGDSYYTDWYSELESEDD